MKIVYYLYEYGEESQHLGEYMNTAVPAKDDYVSLGTDRVYQVIRVVRVLREDRVDVYIKEMALEDWDDITMYSS